MFRYLVLGLMRDGKPRHGYGLMKEYLEKSGVEISTGNFFRELPKLANKGLVQPTANPEGADARRRPYEITPKGIDEFDRWLTGPVPSRSGSYEDELSYRALFLAEVGRDMGPSLLERWQESLWISGKMLERAREAVMTRPADGDPAFKALLLLLGRRLKHVAADLQFLEEFRDAYEKWAVRSDGNRPSAAPPAPSGRPRKNQRDRP
jgi:DNA-binding PadR family transcriptional regulator